MPPSVAFIPSGYEGIRSAVAADTGIDPDEPLDTLDPATMIPLAAAISRVENGTAADRGEIERGWALFSD